MTRFRPLALASAVAMLGLSSAAKADAIDFTGLNIQTNGSASALSATELQLTPNAPELAGSAFITDSFSSAINFTSTFTFSLTGPSIYGDIADGITFIVQNDPNGALALGGGGGTIGAEGIQNSVGVGFQSWDNDKGRIFINGDVFAGKSKPFSLGDQDDLVDVSISYLAGVLSYTATNQSTSQMISDSRVFDLQTLGPQVYFGFTGGTGLSNADQRISNWNLTVFDGSTVAVPEPATWAMMIGGFGLAGAALRRRRAFVA